MRATVWRSPPRPRSFVAEAGDSPQDRAYRVGFKRSKREDYAVDMLRQAREKLDDVDEVNRILAELGRYYNAIADASVVPLGTRKRIIEALEAGNRRGAEALLDECLAKYRVAEDEDPKP